MFVNFAGKLMGTKVFGRGHNTGVPQGQTLSIIRLYKLTAAGLVPVAVFDRLSKEKFDAYV